MIKQQAVRLSLVAMTAVGGLLSAGTANATIKFGDQCETLQGITQKFDQKICNARSDFGARVRCTHSTPTPIDVLEVVAVAADKRTDNSVNCSVVGRNSSGQVTFSDSGFRTSVEGTGDNLNATSDTFQSNSTVEVVLECTLPPNQSEQNCLNHWIIGD